MEKEDSMHYLNFTYCDWVLDPWEIQTSSPAELAVTEDSVTILVSNAKFREYLLEQRERIRVRCRRLDERWELSTKEGAQTLRIINANANSLERTCTFKIEEDDAI